MSTFLFTAIGGTGWKAGIAFSANGLLTIVLLGQQGQGRIVDTSTQPQNQVQRRFLLDVVIAQGASIFQLLSGKNQTLLIRRDSFLVLNLGLDVVDRITWLDIERDSLSCQGLDKDLHVSFSLLYWYMEGYQPKQHDQREMGWHQSGCFCSLLMTVRLVRSVQYHLQFLLKSA